MTDDRIPTPHRDAPPRFVDPRRVGTVVGLVGACVFVYSYTPGFTDPAVVAARLAVVVVVVGALWFLFVAPRHLGPFIAPTGWRIGVYLACVAAELALIALGTRLLAAGGLSELRPALIALVVGLHFGPFAWAFAERMFYVLGGTLVVLGAVGLLVGTPGSALTAAVVSGLAMSAILLAYSLGSFSRRSETREVGDQ